MIKNEIKFLGIMIAITMMIPTQVSGFMPDNGFIPINKTAETKQKFELPNNGMIPINNTETKQEETKVQNNQTTTNTINITSKRVREPLLTSPPKIGSQIAKILVDENKPAYNADGKPNWDNYNGAYSFGNIGSCAWYVEGRFYEATGIDDYTYGKLFTSVSIEKGLPQSIWLDNADREDLPAVYSIRDPKGIVPQSIAVWDGHVVYVEYVEYDSKGNPTEVYFSESNYDNDTGKYRPGIDGVIKKESFNDFINRSMHGEIKGYVAAR